MVETIRQSQQMSVGHAYNCSVPGCDEIATVMVGSLVADERSLCAPHWQRARALAPSGMHPLRLIPRPDCSVAGCDQPAGVIMTHSDGRRLPACERHQGDDIWELLANPGHQEAP